MLEWLDFGYGPVEIEVRRASLRTDANASIITERAQAAETDPDKKGWWTAFGAMCSQTIRAVGLPFDPVALHAKPDAEIQAAYAQFEDALPPKLIDAWRRAIDAADAPPEPLLADPNVDRGAGSAKSKEKRQLASAANE